MSCLAPSTGSHRLWLPSCYKKTDVINNVSIIKTNVLFLESKTKPGVETTHKGISLVHGATLEYYDSCNCLFLLLAHNQNLFS